MTVLPEFSFHPARLCPGSESQLLHSRIYLRDGIGRSWTIIQLMPN